MKTCCYDDHYHIHCGAVVRTSSGVLELAGFWTFFFLLSVSAHLKKKSKFSDGLKTRKLIFYFLAIFGK